MASLGEEFLLFVSFASLTYSSGRPRCRIAMRDARSRAAGELRCGSHIHES